MPALQSTLPWGAVPFGSAGPYQPGINVTAHVAQLAQQLQQLQQAEYVHQQQLQIVQQLLQVIPQQIQQLQTFVQILPQQIAQIVQQAVPQSPSIATGFGASPISGFQTSPFQASPLQSAAFGVPFSSIAPGGTPPYTIGQPGYVM